MSQEVSFAFNDPVGVFLAYGLFLLVLAVPVWKMWRMRTVSGSIWSFLFSAKGFPYSLLILLGFFWLYLVIVGTHTGFWTLHLVDAEHLALDYWFPHSDYVVQPQNIREFTLVTHQRRSKGDVINQYWLITLVTRKGDTYTSVDIHKEASAKGAITALERWAGRTHIHYLRDCSDPWGVVCSTTRVSKEYLSTPEVVSP